MSKYEKEYFEPLFEEYQDILRVYGFESSFIEDREELSTILTNVLDYVNGIARASFSWKEVYSQETLKKCLLNGAMSVAFYTLIYKEDGTEKLLLEKVRKEFDTVHDEYLEKLLKNE